MERKIPEFFVFIWVEFDVVPGMFVSSVIT
jgi:hypothetical protein